MSARWLLVLALAAAAPPAAAQPQAEKVVTLFAGYRFGGELEDVATKERWKSDEGGMFALALELGIDRKTQYQLYVSRRNGSLRAGSFLAPVSGIGLDITYAHVGGTSFVEDVTQGAYLTGGLGLTHFSPREPGFGPETRFSLSVGGGYLLPLSRRVALRLEGRAFATLVNSGTSFLCSGGCVVQIQGDTFTQGEVLAGLAARF